MFHSFDYPNRPHLRRHAPPTSKDYRRFKDYLRDEFKFRCVYCLTRETWMGSHHFFSVEHYQPKSEVSSGRVYYPNLLYACMDCNRAKGAKQFPDGIHPEENPYGRHLKFEHTGLVRNVSAEGVFLIQQLNLNEALRVDYRRKHYELLEEGLRRLDDPRATRQLRDFFGFPLDMPIFLPNAGAVRPYSERTDLPDWY